MKFWNFGPLFLCLFEILRICISINYAGVLNFENLLSSNWEYSGVEFNKNTNFYKSMKWKFSGPFLATEI